jgi:hypothetical protein
MQHATIIATVHFMSSTLGKSENWNIRDYLR